MTKREAFKLGFLGKVAELGLTPTKFAEVTGLTKRADPISELLSTAKDIALPLAGAAVIGIPWGMGKLTGMMEAGLTDVSEADVERMKMQDYINTYRSEAQKVKRKLQRDQWREGHTDAGTPR